MRLIDADAFLKDNKEFADREIEHPRYQETVRELIDEAPSIEPKRGVWIDICDKYCFEGTFKCSVCGTPWTLIDGTPQDNGMNFCPNCGADMRGKDDEMQ